MLSLSPYLSLGTFPAEVEGLHWEGVTGGHPVHRHDEAKGLGRWEEEAWVVQLQNDIPPYQVWNLVWREIKRRMNVHSAICPPRRADDLKYVV